MIFCLFLSEFAGFPLCCLLITGKRYQMLRFSLLYYKSSSSSRRESVYKHLWNVPSENVTHTCLSINPCTGRPNTLKLIWQAHFWHSWLVSSVRRTEAGKTLCHCGCQVWLRGAFWVLNDRGWWVWCGIYPAAGWLGPPVQPGYYSVWDTR